VSPNSDNALRVHRFGAGPKQFREYWWVRPDSESKELRMSSTETLQFTLKSARPVSEVG
jgi:hypothetical protein